jgi:hypothetical protein
MQAMQAGGYRLYAGWQAGYAGCAGWLVMMAMLPGYSGMLCGGLFWLAILADIYADILASNSGRLSGYAEYAAYPLYAGGISCLFKLPLLVVLAAYPGWLCCVCCLAMLCTLDKMVFSTGYAGCAG